MKYKVATYCDFGESNRKTVIRKHMSFTTAGKAYIALWNIYHRIHGWKVWQEIIKS